MRIRAIYLIANAYWIWYINLISEKSGLGQKMDFLLETAELIGKYSGIGTDTIRDMMETPPEENMGDYALPCFKLSRQLKMPPDKIAAELAEKIIKPEFIFKIEQAGGYLNFFLDRVYFIKDTLLKIEAENQNYGKSGAGSGKTICIDYSSVNIAKPFHIGHLLTTVIGHSLYRIFEFIGYKCVGINHLGDWGTQFGKLICAYKRWGDKKKIESRSVKEMLSLYVKFHDEAQKDESLEDEARLWFKKIEDGDSEALLIFNWFKELTLKEVKKVYDIFDIKFDSYDGESFYNDKMQPVIDELNEKKLLKKSDGAYVVDLDEGPPCIILKSDGATLYSTRDLAAAFYRKKTYGFHKCLYVVAYQQSLHFRQVFKVIEAMGYEWAKDLVHVSFGMVSLEDGTLSTRKGKVVFLEDVLKKSVEKTLAIINEKNPDIADKENTARDIGVGAVVFYALLNNRIKDMVFSWERALNFDGETGPYVQYTHVRCNSVLKKAGGAYDGAVPDFKILDNEEAFAVVKLLYAFPGIIKEAAVKYEPSIITRHIIDISQAFNRYYFGYRIIEEDRKKTKARLMLTKSVKAVLKTGLYLIGVKSPEQM